MFNVNSPRSDDQGIEQEIKAKGLTAPRVTSEDIDKNIISELYFTALDKNQAEELIKVNGDNPEINVIAQSLSLLTICVLVLSNGFTVTGESACASPENFDAEIGRKIARSNAVNKVWPLMGYALKEKLSG